MFVRARARHAGLFNAVLLVTLLATTQSFPRAHAQPTEHAPDTMEARLLACAACHGKQGQGTENGYFPRLAGKPSGYLMNQLVAFRDGRRRYPPMNYLLEYIPDAYLQKMADYFAALRPPPLPPPVAEVSQAVLEQGRSIVTAGDPQRDVPACQRCHGPALTGMEPGIPGLAGLHAKLHKRTAWRLALRHPHGQGTGLHATYRREPDRTRCHSRRGLACVAANSARFVPGTEGHPADAAQVRQRTAVRGAWCGS